MRETIELRWIDTHERLPGLEKQVMTYICGVNGGVMFNHLHRDPITDDYKWVTKGVVAWWPLPEGKPNE